MKHLSRVLSLALVIALSLGLVVTAGAAVTEYENYTDIEALSPQYTEATDVLTALGIFQGNEDNSLNPQGTFTRAQAAKIATYISIGATAAERLSPRVSKFADVSVSHWANKYIEYGVEKGIINGVSADRFSPEGSVTGAQLAKMLLVALGYGAKDEYVGASWELNAIVDGQKRGILTVDTNYSEPAKREEAIQYVFNTIRSDNIFGKNYLVKYSNLINDYVLANGSVLAIGDTGTAQFLGTETFGLISKSVTDNYGRAGHIWGLGPTVEITDYYSNGMKIATSTNGTILQKVGVNGSKYSLTDDASPNYIADLQEADGTYTNATAYINGLPIGDVIAGGDILSDNNTPNDLTDDYYIPGATSLANTSSDRTGVIVELWDLTYNGKIDRVVIIEKQVGTITSAPSVNSTTNYVTIGGVTPEPVAATKIDYPAGLVRDDVVLTHTDKNGVLHIELAKTVTGSVLRATNNLENGVYSISLTLGGEVYRETQLRGVLDNTTTHFDFADFTDDRENFDVDATGYLDDNGNLVKVVLNDTGVLNYLYVIGTQNAGYTLNAQVVFPNGSNGIITVSKLDTVAQSTTFTGADHTFYTYSINASGGYDLRTVTNQYELDDSGPNTTNANTAGGIWRSTAFNGNVTLTGGGLSNGKALVADSKTVFLVHTVTSTPADVYRAYTGYASVPLFSQVNIANDYSVAAIGNNHVAKIVYIDGAAGEAVGGGTPVLDYVFFIDITRNYTLSKVGDTYYYEAPAIVDNKLVTNLKVEEAAWLAIRANGSNLVSVTYDGDIVASSAPGGTTGTGTEDAKNGRVPLTGSGSYGFTSGATHLFYITYGQDRAWDVQGVDPARYVDEVAASLRNDWYVQPPASTSADFYEIGTLFIIHEADTAGINNATTAVADVNTAITAGPTGVTATLADLVSSTNAGTLTAFGTAIDAAVAEYNEAVARIALLSDDYNLTVKTALSATLAGYKATIDSAKQDYDDAALVILYDNGTSFATSVTDQATALANVKAVIEYNTVAVTAANWNGTSSNGSLLTITLNSTKFDGDATLAFAFTDII